MQLTTNMRRNFPVSYIIKWMRIRNCHVNWRQFIVLNSGGDPIWYAMCGSQSVMSWQVGVLNCELMLLMFSTGLSACLNDHLIAHLHSSPGHCCQHGCGLIPHCQGVKIVILMLLFVFSNCIGIVFYNLFLKVSVLVATFVVYNFFPKFQKCVPKTCLF